VSLARIALDRRREVEIFGSGPPVTHVYDAQRYAWGPHEQYLERFG